MLVAIVELVFSDEGKDAFELVHEQMRQELGTVPGFLDYRQILLSGNRYLLLSFWEGKGPLDRWVENAFHRSVLMANFRNWCVEGWFSYGEHAGPRAKRCSNCGRWTRGEPGWDPSKPSSCFHCKAAFGRE